MRGDARSFPEGRFCADEEACGFTEIRGRDETRPGPQFPLGSHLAESAVAAMAPPRRSAWERDADLPPSARSSGIRGKGAVLGPRVRGSKMSFTFERGETLAFTAGSGEAEESQPDEGKGKTEGTTERVESGAEERQMARRWYDDEEEGVAVREDGEDPFQMDEEKVKRKEEQYQRHMTRSDGKRMTLKQSKRAEQLQRDTNAWEENRLMTAGIVKRRDVKRNDEDEAESRITLQVHDAKPPFLQGRGSLSKQAEPVVPLKDSTSDIAVAARKPSKLLQQFRQHKEKHKGRERFWETQHTKMGEITGERSANPHDEAQMDEEREDAAEEGGYRKSAQYRQHVQGSGESQAQSDWSKSRTLSEQRKALPVFDSKEDLLSVLSENNILVVVGETGSGKTTQLAQFLYEDGYNLNGKIGCTQPRRVAAMSVAKRVSEEMGVELGSTVGYTIRFEDVTSKSTEIKYMTDGILLRETLRDPDLDGYSCVIMDEAHERSLNTDVLFGILKRVVARRRDFKLIVTSATLNAEKFAEFFGSVPVFHIPGRTFPVEEVHSKTPPEDYVHAAVKQTLQIHLSHPPGDILVFMTGQEEIEAVCWALQERMAQVKQNTSSVPDLLVLPMYSQLPSDLQARIFEKAPSGSRKCVVSTNIAETSLTVDGILYVVDTGMCKLKVYNPKVGMDALQVYPCSQAGVDQRKGRAGRTAPGQCFRVFTEVQYKRELLQNAVPEIQRTNLSNVVLLLKSLNVDDLLSFDFMDPPPKENILNSMYQLWVLGALDDTGVLTPLGQRMVEFPVDPSLARLILESEELECSSEIVTVVAMLSVPSVFFRPKVLRSSDPCFPLAVQEVTI